jgi:L-alanine-DL-glutamate epimerase-like enolase superfamily enzyme
MVRAVRNLGRQGIAATAISAVDNALWDTKARILGVSLVSLLGGARDAVPIYGSGGFTSYSIDQLTQQLGGWARQGIRAVKMKIGRDPMLDRDRVRAARQAIGDDVELFVDANGAYDRKQALEQAARFAVDGVTWFEEPVSSDDLEGLRLIRDRAPAGMQIAAGEYGYDVQYFRRMAEAGAVDVLQADATRCCGITGFLRAGAICDAWCLPMSAHTAPALHAHVCCAVSRIRNLEYFHDHARIERMLFEGALEPRDGMLRPDRSRPGLGIELRDRDAQRFAV